MSSKKITEKELERIKKQNRDRLERVLQEPWYRKLVHRSNMNNKWYDTEYKNS